MKRLLRSVGLLAVVGIAAVAGLAKGDVIPPQPVEGKIKWVYGYDEGKKLARETGKPLFVVFRCER